MIFKEKVRVTMERDSKADAYLGLKRPNRDPPVIKPRSRSLDDLPGHIRVPVLKRQEPRLKPRLDATVAGLQELRVLREKHEKLFEDAKISVGRSVVNSVEELGDVKGSLRFIRQNSASSLGRITEEDTDELFPSEVPSAIDLDKCASLSSNDKLSTIDNCRKGEPVLHQIRSRRPLSLSDSSFLENELNEHGTLCRRNSWSHNSNCRDVLNTTKTGSASSLRQHDKRLAENPLLKNRLSKTETTVNYTSTNTSFNVNQRINASRQNVLGRSRSLSLTAKDNSCAPIQSIPSNRNVDETEPKIRRASLQCGHVITKRTPFIPLSKFLSDLKLSYNYPGPLHAVLMQYGGQSANQSAKSDLKSTHVRRTLFRLDKMEAIDDINADSTSNKSGDEPNAGNNNSHDVSHLTNKSNVTNKTTKSKHDSQIDKKSICMSLNKSLCPEKKRQQSQMFKRNVNDNEINNNSDTNIGNNEKTATAKGSVMSCNDAHGENDDNVFITDQNNSFSSNIRENKIWNKTFSLASDEGYVPSLSDASRVRSRLSIRSESSWMSSEFDDTTSTVDSGVVLPVSHTRERALRTSFASSSMSVMDDATSSMTDSGLDLVSPLLTGRVHTMNVISNSRSIPINCDATPKDRQTFQPPNSQNVHCEQMANRGVEDEKNILKPFTETSL